MLDMFDMWGTTTRQHTRTSQQDTYELLKNSLLPSLGANRSGAVIPGEVSKQLCPSIDALKAHMSRLQSDLVAHFNGIEQDILQSLRGSIKHERLVQKKGPVGDGNSALVEPYFRRLQLTSAAVERLGYDEEIVAHNGWVMDWPATEDFAAPS